MAPSGAPLFEFNSINIHTYLGRKLCILVVFYILDTVELKGVAYLVLQNLKFKCLFLLITFLGIIF